MFLDTGFHKLNHLHGKAAHAIKSKPISSLDQGHSPWIYTYRSLAHVCSATHPPCSHDWIMGNSLFRWAKTIHPVSVWPGRQSACLRTHIFLLFITCFYWGWTLIRQPFPEDRYGKMGESNKVCNSHSHATRRPSRTVFLSFLGPWPQKTVHRVPATSCIFPPTELCWPAFLQGMSFLKLPAMLKAHLGAHLLLICPDPQVKLTQLPCLKGLRVSCWNPFYAKHSSLITIRDLVWTPKLPTKG